MADLSLGTVLWVSLVGGGLALDGTSFGQTMVSRPLVAATVTGALAGSPAAGVTIGLVLEALQLSVLPVGASRTPESAPAAVVAAAVYATSSGTPFLLLSTVLFALVWERVGSETIHGFRYLNARFASVGEVAARGLERQHILACGADALRGTLVTATGYLLLSVLTTWFERRTIADEAIVVLIGAIVAACFGALFTILGRDRWRMFAAGVLLGGLLLAAS